jgi:type II secretory pathway pseudopilin PulG
VVVAIISLLSSILLVNLGKIREKAKDTAALSLGIQMAKAIEACSIEGGKVTAPNSTTNPTNNFCTVGNSYKWPKPPQGWTWSQQSWVNGENNMIHLASTYNTRRMYCGHYPSWVSYYSCPSSPQKGICRMIISFSYAIYNPSTGIWE